MSFPWEFNFRTFRIIIDSGGSSSCSCHRLQAYKCCSPPAHGVALAHGPLGVCAISMHKLKITMQPSILSYAPSRMDKCHNSHHQDCVESSHPAHNPYHIPHITHRISHIPHPICSPPFWPWLIRMSC